MTILHLSITSVGLLIEEETIENLLVFRINLSQNLKNGQNRTLCLFNNVFNTGTVGGYVELGTWTEQNCRWLCGAGDMDRTEHFVYLTMYSTLLL